MVTVYLTELYTTGEACCMLCLTWILAVVIKDFPNFGANKVYIVFSSYNIHAIVNCAFIKSV